MVLTITRYMFGFLLFLFVFHVGASKWPAHTDVEDNASFDYIIVGAGSAGSVLANRLTEQEDVKVLLVEAGGDPPDDIDALSLFVTDLHPDMYWKYETEDSQNLEHKHISLRAGKVLGGSSTIHYMLYNRGVPTDYERWVNITGDQSLSWENNLQYFMKSEQLHDDKIMNSENQRFHGKTGEMVVTKDRRETTLKYLEAFHELGHRIVEDFSAEKIDGTGYTQPMLWLSKGTPQNAANSFLVPIQNRKNLSIMKNTLVNKILFDENKNAVGVQITKPNGMIAKIFGKKEIIVSAGAFNSPKLLMLSGVGPRAHLESLHIPVISDLPVGKNLKDHLAVILPLKGEETYDVYVRNKMQFPVSILYGRGALDRHQHDPDYFNYNLIFKNHPEGIRILCSLVLHLSDDICSELIAASKGKEVMLGLFAVSHPMSQGDVQLRTSNPEDPPQINIGFLSNPSDLDFGVKCIQDFTKVVNTTYFKSIGGDVLHVDLPKCKHLKKNTDEYWKCYILNMMTSHFHYCCTNPIGSVLDPNFKVRGVNKLRVVDASAMPDIISGSIGSAVYMLAEKAADLIKQGV